MKVICAWCERDGQPAVLGERSPLVDERPTHGICGLHLERYLLSCEPMVSGLPDQPLCTGFGGVQGLNGRVGLGDMG